MTGTIQTLIEIFNHVFARLNVTIPATVQEELAITVYSAMTGNSRQFHSLDHALSFWSPENPLQTLAALFHDIVYYHVDLGYQPEIEALISPYLTMDADQTTRLADIPAGDRIYALTLAAFDFAPDQSLAAENGLNEFLSALFMNKKLQPYLDEVTLLKLTVYIEATIPFRPVDYFNRIEVRIDQINQIFALGLSSPEIKGIVRASVDFANTDVKNFASSDPSILLDDTWKLLPELNIALRQGIYTVRDYRRALQKMKQFMSSLKPELIFHHYENTPFRDDYEHMLCLARENLTTALEYLNIKLLSAAVLEALAEVSGGDAPLSLFLGDFLPEPEQRKGKNIENFLPEPNNSQLLMDNQKLYHLLAERRNSHTNQDLRNAPLSVFIFQNLDPDKAAEKLSSANRYFDGAMTASEFLDNCKSSAISAIARAIAEMVPTRRDRLNKYTRTD